MLHTETVARPTLELLKKLENECIMSKFNLAGGTALALYLGHRISVDLDLFSSEPFDNHQLEIFLHDNYGFRTDFMERNTLKGTIEGIKVDCIAHQYGYSFYSMLKLYERKFPDSNVIRLIKTMTYFEDIDFDEDIMILNSKYDWELIEDRLVEMTKEQTKVFTLFPLPKK